MLREDLVMRYRETDRDIALFAKKLTSTQPYELSLLVPDAQTKRELFSEWEALSARADALETPEPVFTVLKRHFCDFIRAKRLDLINLFEKPAALLAAAVQPALRLSRVDARPDDIKADVIIGRLAQLPAIWEGARGWIAQAKPEYLCAFPRAMLAAEKNLSYHAGQIGVEFPGLDEEQSRRLLQAEQDACALLHEYADYVTQNLLTKEEHRAESDDDCIRFEEDYYRTLLRDSLGVDLDEILSWYETEMEATRAEVFRIARSLDIPENNPKTMVEVNDILLKYAGPCRTPKEMFERCKAYLLRARKAAKTYVWLPEEESCGCTTIPEQNKLSFPWGGYGGGDPTARPIYGQMSLNQYNYKAVTDGWLKMMSLHEAYPGHHVQYVRRITDTLPETVKMGVRHIPVMEGAAHRTEKVFEFVFPEDPFYPLFVAYRRHHTAVRIKADLMLRYFGNPIRDAVKLYRDELGYDQGTARGQVKAQETMEGYFTCYYYGLKKIADLEKKSGYDEKTFTELLFSAGGVSVEVLEAYLALSEEQRQSYLHDFGSLFMNPAEKFL